MSHLKLVVLIYLTAFAIFGHKIEYVSSSTAALKKYLKVQSPEMTIENEQRNLRSEVPTRCDDQLLWKLYFTFSPELYGFDPQHESGFTQMEVALEPPLPPFHSVMASVSKKINIPIKKRTQGPLLID